MTIYDDTCLYQYILYLNTCWVWDDHIWPHMYVSVHTIPDYLLCVRWPFMTTHACISTYYTWILAEWEMTIYDHTWSVSAHTMTEYLLTMWWPFMTTYGLYQYIIYLNTCCVWDDHLWPHIVCISIVNSSTRILTIIIASLKLFKENYCFKITLCFIS